MCRALKVERSGYYSWIANPISQRAKENKIISKHVKTFWEDSQRIYGYRKIHNDLQNINLIVGKDKVRRLMRSMNIKAMIGSKKKHAKYGKPSVLANNLLKQDFDVGLPNVAWVTDITYIWTSEGWLYLCVILDLFARRIVGWDTGSQQKTKLILSALGKAVRQRKPSPNLVVHSDQGTQFTSYAWRGELLKNDMIMSNSRRGNCFDNAVAENFFSLIKREAIQNTVFKTREEVRCIIFEYIEMFYNPTRQHSYLGGLSPAEYEKAYLSS